MKLIDLTNNSDLEREPLRAFHTRPSLIIHIKDKYIRSPNTQKHELNPWPTHQQTRQGYALERRTTSFYLQPDQHEYQAPRSVFVDYNQYALFIAPQTTQDHGSWPDGKYARLFPYVSKDDYWCAYFSYQDEHQSFLARTYRTNWQPLLGLLDYKYNLQASYASLYKYDRWYYYNSAYEYKRRLILDKDYEDERKLIWGHVGKDEVKPLLAQEFERKTIPACDSVQEPPLALASPAPTSLAPSSPAFASPTLAFLALAPFAPTPASQKFKSNLPDEQEHPALAAKDSECQVPNPDTSCEKLLRVQVVQEVDKPCSRSLSPTFNKLTNSGPVIPFPSDT